MVSPGPQEGFLYIMPIYEYVCEDCEAEFEQRRSFSETGPADCPQCKGRTRRVFRASPVIFKGAGFYVTDSRTGSPPKED
jgi:putative FmdB family regulatory protein